MPIDIRLTGQLQAAFGTDHFELDLPDGPTIQKVIELLLERQHSATAGDMLLDRDGRLPASLLIAINDRAFPARSVAARVVAADDRIILLPAIAGG